MCVRERGTTWAVDALISQSLCSLWDGPRFDTGSSGAWRGAAQHMKPAVRAILRILRASVISSNSGSDSSSRLKSETNMART